MIPLFWLFEVTLYAVKGVQEYEWHFNTAGIWMTHERQLLPYPWGSTEEAQQEIRREWWLRARNFVIVVQLFSRVWLFVTSWTATCQASPSSTISRSLLKFMSIDLVLLSNRLILCCPFSCSLQSFLASGSFPKNQNIPGPYAILLFTASAFTVTTKHIHNWLLFPLWPRHFILSGAISNCPLLNS